MQRDREHLLPGEATLTRSSPQKSHPSTYTSDKQTGLKGKNRIYNLMCPTFLISLEKSFVSFQQQRKLHSSYDNILQSRHSKSKFEN